MTASDTPTAPLEHGGHFGLHLPGHDHFGHDRRPTTVDLVAGLFLFAAVVLHIVAMGPMYLANGTSDTSIFSQSDQAALYAILSAGWAAALIIGLLGPNRMEICAGAAVGLAVTEFGFRVADVGEVIKYGSNEGGAGVWLLAAGWVCGAVGAIAAVMGARRRRRQGTGPARPIDFRPVASGGGWPTGAAVANQANPAIPQAGTAPGSGPDWIVDWPAPAAAPERGPQWGEPPVPTATLPAAEPDPTVTAPFPGAASNGSTDSTAEVDALRPTDPTLAVPTDPTVDVPSGAPTQSIEVPSAPVPSAPVPSTQVASRSGETMVFQAIPDEDPGSRVAWVIGVAVLALLTAGAYLPAWDRYVGYNSTSGASGSFTLGDAWNGPWQIVLGNLIVAAFLVIVLVAAIMFRNRAVGAALGLSSLLVLGTQFVSAVIQVDEPVPSSLQAANIVYTVKLTAWFAVDVLAAFVLVAVLLIWATARAVQENSPGTVARAPDFRSDSIPWVS